MSTDFETQWQRKLSNSIQQHTDDITPQKVLAGGEALCDQTPRLEIIAWSQNAMGKEWGQPGIIDNHTITVTKIPKSGYLKEYLAAPDAQGKREVYYHCPRVRDAIKLGETLPAVYCHCGAGFYKHIWETILQESVKVEVLESVLQGDDMCTIAVHLPKYI